LLLSLLSLQSFTGSYLVMNITNNKDDDRNKYKDNDGYTYTILLKLERKLE